MSESKQCVECNAPFTKDPRYTWAKWARQECCSGRCANALRARGRPKAIGDLSRRDLGGKGAWVAEWQRRKAMPRWAAWWEQQRRTEDLADLATVPIVYGKGAQVIAKAPRSRLFIGSACRACDAMWLSYAAMPDTDLCSPCNKKRWQGNHRQRAKKYGVAFEHIEPHKVFAIDSYRCQLCGHKTKGKFPSLASPTIDHIIPMSCGGPHLWHNVQTACFKCNMQKHSGSANDQLRLAIH